MPDQLQLRGGTTTEHNSFTGAAREVTVDTTKKTLVVHDGSTQGGTPLMKESGAIAASSVQIGTGGVERFKITSSEVVFNETSTDTDFRIESNDQTSIFHVNAGDNTVGIRTATPDRLLTINASATTRMNLKTSSSSTVGIEFGDSDDFNAGFIVYDNSDNSLGFGVNGAGEKLRIDSNGSLLLGTSVSNSSDIFRIVDAGNVFVSIRSDAEADSRVQNLEFGYGTADRSSTNLTGIISARTHSQSSGQLKANLVFLTNSGDSIDEKMVLTDTGSLGIGIGNGTPAGKFHVKLSTDKHIIFNDGQGEVGNVPCIVPINDSSLVTDLGFRANHLNFAAGTGSQSSAQKMTIDDTGVAIGQGNVDAMGLLHIDCGTDKNIVYSGGIGEIGNLAGFQCVNDASNANTGFGIRASEIRFAITNSERFRVTSNGVTFNGDTAAANALDDYEEGTFSATASAAGYSGGSAISMSGEQYTKIGRLVFFRMHLTVASSLSDGDLTITGLPFTASKESVINFAWQDAASFHGGQGIITGTQCVRFNGVFPTHSSGNATIRFSGTYNV